ncbi:MAG: cytochrome c oxidase assembly protein [Betaproteobacteria bacterium]
MSFSDVQMFPRRATWIFAVPLALTAQYTHAHATGLAQAASWNFEPWVVACLLAAGLLYARGAWALWRKAGVGRGLTLAQACAFIAGWITLIAALISPIDALGARLFSAHMVQHELLMVIAAPLFVSARPLETWTWGLSVSWRRGAGRIGHWPPLLHAWSAITAPASAWALHAAALWIWHVPMFFDAALRSEDLHVAQHASFLATALLFWWAVLGRTGARRPGLAIALSFTTMLHTGALGALLTFSPSAWYRGYHHTETFGLTALEDQQLGGLIMWVPGGVAYLAAGLMLVFRHYLNAAAVAEPDAPQRPS